MTPTITPTEGLSTCFTWTQHLPTIKDNPDEYWTSGTNYRVTATLMDGQNQQIGDTFISENITRVPPASNDINGDGFNDLLMNDFGKNTYIYLNNNGNFNINLPNQTLNLPSDTSIGVSALLFDYNGDGLKDVIIGDVDTGTYTIPGKIILIPNEEGTFLISQTTQLSCLET